MAHRTTITLEDDVMDQIQRETRRTGRALKTVVNDALRVGLRGNGDEDLPPFVVEARALGLRPGFDLDDIEALLDQLEGPMRR